MNVKSETWSLWGLFRGRVFPLAAGVLVSAVAVEARSPLGPDPAHEAWFLEPEEAEEPRLQYHGGTSGTAPDVESFVAAALEAHPSLETARLRTEALREAVEPAGALADLTLGLSVSNVPIDEFSLSATPMSGVQLNIAQKLPWPGKRGLAKEAAALEAEASEDMEAERRNQLAFAVRSSYYDLHLTDISLEVARANLETLGGIAEIAEAKYRVGRGLQQDVLKAQVFRDQVQEQILSLERQRRRLEVKLNILMARPESTSIPSLVDVPVTKVEAELDADELVARAWSERPLLRALERRGDAARTRWELAGRQTRPDFTLVGGYRFRKHAEGFDPVEGADFWSLGFSINVPLYKGGKQDALARASESSYHGVRSEIDDELLSIRQVVSDALQQIPRLEEQMELYRESIIPAATQSLEADRVAYQVDKVDFLSLLDIEVRLINYEVEFHRLHVLREKEIARLAHAVGIPPAAIVKGLEVSP